MERIFCAEQINVPNDLPGLLKDYTKAAIRANPDDLLAWSAEYFRGKAGVASKELSAEDIENMRQLFNAYDRDGNGIMDKAELGTFIRQDLGYDIAANELDEVMATLDKDGTGRLEFQEIVQWWTGRA